MAEGVDNMASLAEGPKSLSPKDRKPFLQRTGTKIALAGSAAVLAGAGIGAKMGFFERGESPAQVSIATVPATVVPTEGPQLATPMPSPTPEVTQAPAVNPDAKFPPATPEAQVEVPCLVVDQKLCGRAEHGEYADNRGTWIVIGMNLDKGTIIYSPSKGQDSKIIYTQPAPFKGASANISNPQDTSQGTYVLVGAIDLDNPTVTSDVEPGSRIGTIGDTGENTNFGYNFAVIVKKGSVAENRLTSIFPDAMAQPAKKLENNPSATPTQQQPTPLRGNPPQ